MNGHTATGNGQAVGVIGSNRHTSNGHRRAGAPHVLPSPATASAEGRQLNGAPSSRLPTFVRLALLVRPWWRGVALNLTAALLNQGSGIALAVVSALLVARVATG